MNYHSNEDEEFYCHDKLILNPDLRNDDISIEYIRLFPNFSMKLINRYGRNYLVLDRSVEKYMYRVSCKTI